MKYEYDEKTNTYTPVDENSKVNISKDTEKIIAIALWGIQFVSATFWPIIATIICFIYFKDKSKFITDTVREILNFEISLFIYGAIGLVLAPLLIGWPILIAVGIFNIVIPILGILEAVNNKVYKVPFIIQFLK